MTLTNLLPYLRYTIRNARSLEDIKAIVELLGYGGVDFNEATTQAGFEKAKHDLLEEFDFLVADQEVIYTGNYGLL